MASSLYQVVRGVFADCARMCSARAEAARDSRTDVGRDLALDGAEGSNIVWHKVVPRLWLFPVIKMQQQMQF